MYKTLKCGAIPKPVAHLFKDHHPDVLTLQPPHKVCSLSDDVWYGHDAEQEHHRHNATEVHEHQQAPPQHRPTIEETQGSALLSRAHKAVSNEGHYESPHYNLQVHFLVLLKAAGLHIIVQVIAESTGAVKAYPEEVMELRSS